jgi:hypothetical protein
MQPTSAAALREGNPTVDMGKGAALAEQEKRVAELQDILANMEKSKMFLKDEHLKLQRIEDALQVAETELLEYKDGADVAEKSRFISNVKRLRDERMLCHNRQDMHNGFINTLKDQIAAAELKNNVEGYATAAKPTVDEDSLLDVTDASKAAVQTQYQGNPAVDMVLDEEYKRLEEMREKVANLRKNEELLHDEDLKL